MEHARPDEVVAALRRGDVDAALDAGLMEFAERGRLDHDDVSREERELILAASAKLRFAWDARDRFRAREARLLERTRRRKAQQAPEASAATPETAFATPALPAAAAGALARALALARAKGNI